MVVEAPTPGPANALSDLANASIDLAISSVILGGVTAIILLVLHELFFIRPMVNGFLLKRWFRRPSPIGEVLGPAGYQRLGSLPYRQLCGQLSARASARLQKDFGGEAGGDDGYRKAQTLARDIETEVNALQRMLGAAWLRTNYLLSVIVVAGLILAIVLTPNPFVVDDTASEILAYVVGALASLMAPLILQLLERHFSAR